MPRRRKRANQLADNARKARKKVRIEEDDQTAAMVSLPGPSGIPPDTFTNLRGRSLSSDPTDEDPTFDPAVELETNPTLKHEQFAEEWPLSLDRDDKLWACF